MFIKKIVCLLFISTIILIGCLPANNSIDSLFCQAAQAHLTILCQQNPQTNAYCCQVVKPTLQGKTFQTFCQETESHNIFLNAKCLSTITSCNQIDVCTGTTK